MRSATSGAPFYHYYHHVSDSLFSLALQRRAAVFVSGANSPLAAPFCFENAKHTQGKREVKKKKSVFKRTGSMLGWCCIYACGSNSPSLVDGKKRAPNSRNWIKLSGIDLTRERANYKEYNCGTCLIKLRGQRSIHSGARPRVCCADRRQLKKGAGWELQRKAALCVLLNNYISLVRAARRRWCSVCEFRALGGAILFQIIVAALSKRRSFWMK